MKVSWKIYRLELASPFTISKGTFTHRNALVIKLQDGQHYGLGEVTEISYYDIDLERLTKLISTNYERLCSLDLPSPEEYHQELQPILGHEPFLCSAFDCAAYDLFAKKNGISTRRYIGAEISDQSSLPKTSFTIGLGDIHEMVSKIRKQPWPIYKIKLGYPKDVDIIQAIAESTDSMIRIDANGGWSLEEAKVNIPALHDLGVEFIEQPLPAHDDQQLSDIFDATGIPIIADESCQGPADVEKCYGKYHGINIKLMKCGGITNARNMIKRARELNLKIMLGCMTESSIGISAAAQLMSLVDYVDLDGTMLIKRDIADGVKFVNGQVSYPDAPGHGCHLIPAYDF